MSFQIVDGRFGFVVDLKELPELPIHDGGISQLKPYAEALTEAIENGIIKEPGKYLIAVDAISGIWRVYAINE